MWTPDGLCKWAGASSRPPPLSAPHPPTQKKKALTECSSWSMFWARTGLKETGDRAPGFFLTARICRRARKAVAEGRAHIRQGAASSSTTEALRAPGTPATHPPHRGPRTSHVSKSEAKQSHNRAARKRDRGGQQCTTLVQAELLGQQAGRHQPPTGRTLDYTRNSASVSHLATR